MKTRATTNDEIGINGDTYAKGQFLPSSPLTVKGEIKSNKVIGTRKEEIAPYVWEVAPVGMTSIFTKIGGIFGKVVNGKFVINTNGNTLAYFKKSLQEVEELANRWNNGERWI